MRYDTIAPVFFKKNRAKLLENLEAGAMVFMLGNTSVPKAKDIVYPFLQRPDFFYMTGVDIADCAYLLLLDDQKKIKEEILFLPGEASLYHIWTGRMEFINSILQQKQFLSYSSMDKLQLSLQTYTSQAIHIHTSFPEDPVQASLLPLSTYQQILSSKPSFSLDQRIEKFRCVKSPLEQALIRRAVGITNAGLRAVIPKIKPGVKEYELEAQLNYTFAVEQASGFAYPPIIASGIRSNILHYDVNTATCKDGDLLLMDVGASYANYNADITRVFPVNGRFSPRQRAVYSQVLKTLKSLEGIIKPGLSWSDLEQVLKELMEESLQELGLIDRNDLRHQDANQPLYKKFMVHSLGHHLGLEVHDNKSDSEFFSKGMVLALEPAIYLPKEGFGIRLENDILITESGATVLSDSIPIEPDEIEELMGA